VVAGPDSAAREQGPLVDKAAEVRFTGPRRLARRARPVEEGMDQRTPPPQPGSSAEANPLPLAATTAQPARGGGLAVSHPPSWLNGALTGVVLATVLVAAMDHRGQPLDAVGDIAWILITLCCTALVRWYPKVVVERARRLPPLNLREALRLLRTDWALVAAGVPAVAILLFSLALSGPALVAIRAVLITDVVLLLALGVIGGLRARRGLGAALLLGLADAALGVAVIVANAFLR
jgi:hypothetical protein